MSGINVDWALGELRTFLEMTQMHSLAGSRGGMMIFTSAMATRAPDDEVAGEAFVVEQIFDVALPRWREEVSDEKNKYNRWYQHREAAQRAVTRLERQAEIDAMLGDTSPRLSGSSLHTWIWDVARPLWKGGHYREAIAAAARSLNAETQAKAGRKNLSETKLFQNLLSPDAPKEGQPRLRLAEDDGGDTYRSLHRGVAALAEGAYAAIRNPASHENGLPELTEAEALEQLAIFSYLARRIDEAKLAT